MTNDADKLLKEAAALRSRSLTAEQKERRRIADERSRRIQEGVKAPASGVYGRPPK